MFQVSRNLSPTTFATAGITAVSIAGIMTLPAGAIPAIQVQMAPANPLRSTDRTADSLARPWTSKVIPAAFVDAYREMFSFKSLLDGWDGQGSKAILDDSINAALAFLAMLPSDLPPPEASAASDGTVDWYWRNGSKAATVTFYKNRRAAYFAVTDAGSVKDVFQLTDKIPDQLIESLRQL